MDARSPSPSNTDEIPVRSAVITFEDMSTDRFFDVIGISEEQIKYIDPAIYTIEYCVDQVGAKEHAVLKDVKECVSESPNTPNISPSLTSSSSQDILSSHALSFLNYSNDLLFPLFPLDESQKPCLSTHPTYLSPESGVSLHIDDSDEFNVQKIMSDLFDGDGDDDDSVSGMELVYPQDFHS